MQKNIIITLFFSVIIALFAILNAEVVPINLIFKKIEVSISLVILISASIGAIIIYSFDIVTKMKLKKKLKSTEKNLISLKEENNLLKEKINKYEEKVKVLNEKEISEF